MSSTIIDNILNIPEDLCLSFPEEASPNEIVDIFYSRLTGEMKAQPLLYAHKLREIKPLTHSSILFRKCYDLFVDKFSLSSPALEEHSKYVDPLTKYAIALSNNKLTLLNDSLNSLLQDEAFMNNQVLSSNGLDLIHQIFFTFSISHEKIDVSFIAKALDAPDVSKEKDLIDKILKKCLGRLSPRIGITNPNKELIKKSIKESICYFRQLEKEKQNKFINKEVDLIYDILSIPKRRKQLETQLNKFLQKYNQNSCQDCQDPLIKAFISIQSKDSVDDSKELSTNSIVKWPILKKLALLESLSHTPHFEPPSEEEYPLLSVSKGSIHTLYCLLPIASMFLNNPMPFNPVAILQQEPAPSFDHPMPKEPSSNPLIDVPSYLDHRFPKDLRTFLVDNSKSIEVCLGNEEEFKRTVATKYPDYRFKAQLTTISSLNFFVYSKKDNLNDIKIFVQNITSPARLNHFSYILKHIGVTLGKLPTLGSFEEVYEKERKALENWSSQWKEQPKVLFIGTSILPYIGKDMKVKDKLETPNNTMLCRGSYLKITGPDQKSLPVLSFSMPNGELSGVLTKFCLEKGIETIIMLGAGGALKSKDFTPHISDYISFSSSYLDDQILSIPQENLHPLVHELPKDLPFYNQRETHQTVSSPLLEDETWLNEVESKNVSIVDVETAHIVKNFLSEIAKNPNIKILPGLFISDVVNVKGETLTEKISSEKAFANTPELINKLLKVLK